MNKAIKIISLIGKFAGIVAGLNTKSSALASSWVCSFRGKLCP